MGTSVPAILARVRSPQKEESRERSVPLAVRAPCPSPSFPAIFSSSNDEVEREFSPVFVNLASPTSALSMLFAESLSCVFCASTRNNNRKNQRLAYPKRLCLCLLHQRVTRDLHAKRTNTHPFRRASQSTQSSETQGLSRMPSTT